MPSVDQALAADGADDRPAPPSSVASAADADAGGTFWCRECRESVTLASSSPPLSCPRCRGHFLEETEGPRLHPPPPLPLLRLLSPTPPPIAPDRDPAEADADADTLALPRSGQLEAPLGIGRRRRRGPEGSGGTEDYSQVFDRLINQIFSDDHHVPGTGAGSGGRPASRSSVAALPTVQITEGFLAADPFLLCAVCKEEFVVQAVARRLPCSHIYHPYCILPWLSQRNSCPVCRFLLPAEEEEEEEEEEERRLSPASVAQPREVLENLLDEFMDDIDRDVMEIHRMVMSVSPESADILAESAVNLRDSGDTRRRAVRRRRLLPRRSRLEVAAAASTTQLAQTEMGSEALANDPNRVSSRCPLDGVSGVGGSSTDAGGRVDENGDVVLSEVGYGPVHMSGGCSGPDVSSI